ncbi:MAG: TPM domain-containing protein [Bacteroidia bacterium]|nr:TPM domain-containing protein [Bacteroidia bacterium]
MSDHTPSARDFFSPEASDHIIAAIQAAEQETAGEIRVHLEDTCRPETALGHARRLFEKLGMTQTQGRNGVLIYLAIQDRQFAIVGDTGIHALVPAGYWDGLADTLVRHFRAGAYEQGLISIIRDIGQQLALHFPRQDHDANELPDEISFS